MARDVNKTLVFLFCFYFHTIWSWDFLMQFSIWKYVFTSSFIIILLLKPTFSFSSSSSVFFYLHFVWIFPANCMFWHNVLWPDRKQQPKKWNVINERLWLVWIAALCFYSAPTCEQQREKTLTPAGLWKTAAQLLCPYTNKYPWPEFMTPLPSFQWENNGPRKKMGWT